MSASDTKDAAASNSVRLVDQLARLSATRHCLLQQLLSANVPLGAPEVSTLIAAEKIVANREDTVLHAQWHCPQRRSQRPLLDEFTAASLRLLGDATEAAYEESGFIAKASTSSALEAVKPVACAQPAKLLGVKGVFDEALSVAIATRRRELRGQAMRTGKMTTTGTMPHDDGGDDVVGTAVRRALCVWRAAWIFSDCDPQRFAAAAPVKIAFDRRLFQRAAVDAVRGQPPPRVVCAVVSCQSLLRGVAAQRERERRVRVKVEACKRRQMRLFTDSASAFAAQMPLVRRFARCQRDIDYGWMKLDAYEATEEEEFTRQWRAWEVAMRRHVIHEVAFDPGEWLELPPGSSGGPSDNGRPTYLNLKTGRTQTEHPNVLQAEMLRNRQWLKATKAREERRLQAVAERDRLTQLQTEAQALEKAIVDTSRFILS